MQGIATDGGTHPASVSLIGVQLRLRERANVLLVGIGECGNGTGVLAVARTNIRAAGHGSIIACANAEPIEPLCAVGLRPGPLSNNGPFVGAS